MTGPSEIPARSERRFEPHDGIESALAERVNMRAKYEVVELDGHDNHGAIRLLAQRI